MLCLQTLNVLKRAHEVINKHRGVSCNLKAAKYQLKSFNKLQPKIEVSEWRWMLFWVCMWEGFNWERTCVYAPTPSSLEFEGSFIHFFTPNSWQEVQFHHILDAYNPYTCSKRYFACSTFDTMTGLLHLTELLMCFCKAPVSHALVFSCLVCIPVRVVLTISRYVFQW